MGCCSDNAYEAGQTSPLCECSLLRAWLFALAPLLWLAWAWCEPSDLP